MKAEDTAPESSSLSTASEAAAPHARRTLVLAGITHALHDGYTDLIYILLPVWQAEFALGYGMLAMLRGLYAGAMAALQVPAGRLAERFGARLVLVLGTILAAIGFVIAGFSGGLFGLCVGLFLSGAGSSTQHPIASTAVAAAYGRGTSSARAPLGTYNFSGDLGKAAFPALMALFLSIMSWRSALDAIAVLGIITAVAIALFMPPIRHPSREDAVTGTMDIDRSGFPLLFAMGVLDSAVRMGLHLPALSA